MRVNLVHDWLMFRGGAEKVLESLVELFRPRRIYTLFYEKSLFPGSPISQVPIVTSFLDHRLFKSRFWHFIPLFPFAMEQFDADGADVLISCSTCVAKGVLPKTDQIHICYCNTPMRYAWDLSFDYLGWFGLDRGLKGLLWKVILHYLRNWDVGSSARVDHFISSSNFVGRRIRKYYRRESTTIYPPCAVEPLKRPVSRGEHFIFVSRLVPQKRADLAIRAFNELKVPLRVAGEGPLYRELRNLASDHISFLGYLEDEDLKREIASSRALIFPALEDFGIVPVEAQALGTPVIALGKGGALETVIPPKDGDFSEATGILFENQDKDSLKEAVRTFMDAEKKFNPLALSKNARRFSKNRFAEEMSNFVRRKYEEFREAPIRRPSS